MRGKDFRVLQVEAERVHEQFVIAFSFNLMQASAADIEKGKQISVQLTIVKIVHACNIFTPT